MCDTIVAPPTSTREAITLFGKNSDRQRNEAQAVELHPGAIHPPGARLKCTYIEIPQARATYAVVLSRPFWMWGAEMGANEHGVVIGNEGLNARMAAPEAEALLGMDLLRLALERAATAAEAVEVITGLLEQHGQGGNCGHLQPAYYNNGFIIADPAEAFVMETVGKEWLTQRVCAAHSISNGYTIRQDAEQVSAGMERLLGNLGWKGNAPIDYAAAIADPEREHIGQAASRQARSAMLLRLAGNDLGAEHFMSVLRDHGDQEPWDPSIATHYGLCIHAASDKKIGQTTAAMVSEVRRASSVHWVTGTAATCISIFKPVLMNVPLPSLGPIPTERFDARTLWWRHERLHRAALMDSLPRYLHEIQQERDALEAHFRTRIREVLQGASIAEQERVVAECWNLAQQTQDRWFAQLPRAARQPQGEYQASWSKMNALAALVEEMSP